MARFFASGRYAKGTVQRTLSPSMDIQVASNFERLLADLAGRDGAAVQAWMAGLARDGEFTLDGARLAERARALRRGAGRRRRLPRRHRRGLAHDRADDRPAQRRRRSRCAPATSAARAPMVSLATAHPAKFPDAIERAIGIRPALPPRLAALAR